MVGSDGTTVLGTVDAAAAGQTALLQTVQITQAGTYRIDARSIAGSGRYRVRAMLNALLATDANNTQQTAQSLESSFISLGATATRGAVRGTLDGVNSDWYSFTLNAGEAETLALAHDLHLQSPAVSLELYSGDNVLIAVGRTDAINVDRFISDFVPTAAGTYYVRVSGITAGAYSLLLARGISLQLSSNETGVLQNITPSGLLLGNLGSGSSGSGSAPAGTASLPLTLVDATGYRWDIQGSGYIGDGVSDAYDGGMQHTGFPNFYNVLTEENAREVVLNAPTAANGIEVSRKIYVPQAQSFARFLEIVTNNSANTINYTVPIYTNLGSDGYEPFVMTSSGDASVTTSDNWVITDDTATGGSSGTAASPSSDPVVTHVVAGQGGRIRPSTFVKNSGEVSYSYGLTLAPGETKIIMHFAAMAGNQANALALAPQLTRLELDALAGMSANERRAVVNFN
ncbi:MAG: pre-peptidase C-terminal domain-containing protein, partial [Caldilinea sp.]|nr:pre-peptidase C-terminal domain-containing protein [Caldilinea sp.]